MFALRATMPRLAGMLAIWCLTQGLVASAAEPLRWKFEAGNTWEVKFERTSDVVTTIGGTATKQYIQTSVLANWNVESVEGESAVITQTVAHVVVDIDFNRGEPLHFESSAVGEGEPTVKLSGNAKLLADATQPLLAKKTTWTVSNRGQVLKSENVDSSSAANPPTSTTPAAVNAASIDHMVRQIFTVLPENPVSPGEMWTDTITLAAKLGKFEQATTYTVQPPVGDENSAIHIVSNSTLGKVATSGPKGTVTENQQQGDLVFDAQQGAIKSVQTKQEFTTTSTVKDTVIVVRVNNDDKVTLTLKTAAAE